MKSYIQSSRNRLTTSTGTEAVVPSLLSVDASKYSKPFAGISLDFSSVGDTNGLVYYLGTNKRTAAFSNPHVSGKLIVSNSDGPSNDALNQVVVDRTYSGGTSTANVANSWVQLDAYQGTLKPTRYAFQNRAAGGLNHYIVTWKLEASNDLTTWDVLHTGTSTPTGYSTGTMASFGLSSSTYYRYFRITQTGNNSDGAFYLCIGEIEFYGVFKLNP
jgi:hypothetical protein